MHSGEKRWSSGSSGKFGPGARPEAPPRTQELAFQPSPPNLQAGQHGPTSPLALCPLLLLYCSSIATRFYSPLAARSPGTSTFCAPSRWVPSCRGSRLGDHSNASASCRPNSPPCACRFTLAWPFGHAGACHTLPASLWPCFGTMPDASQSFLFAGETVSNTIPCAAYMARGIAMIAAICRQPGDGAGFRAVALTHAKLTVNS